MPPTGAAPSTPGVAIVAVDYALAPEHRYPVQVEQGYAALVWLFERADELGVDPSRIGVLGMSAGGNIAAAVTLMNRDRAELPAPAAGARGSGRRPHRRPHRPARDAGASASRALSPCASCARWRAPTCSSPDHALEPYASPLLAPSHEGLPPRSILTAEYDPLRGDGDAYAAALRRAGVDASAVRYQGVTHDVAIFTGALPAARRWHDDVVAALRRLHARVKARGSRDPGPSGSHRWHPGRDTTRPPRHHAWRWCLGGEVVSRRDPRRIGCYFATFSLAAAAAWVVAHSRA